MSFHKWPPLLMRKAKEGVRLAVIAQAVLWVPHGVAVTLDTNYPDLKVRWDNTIKYSNAFRLGDRSSMIAADASTDDGDRNFGKGLVSNRVDLFSELDISYRKVGLRLSGAAWYDDVYNKRNDNDSPGTSNNVSGPFNSFTHATRDRMGRKAELLDAFVFANGTISDMAATVRFGRHSLVYGESIFFGNNGIASANGPIDVVKLVSVPSSQFKEVLRPVEQLSAQMQLTSALSASAYYQFKWRPTILPPAGSYLSVADVVGEGAERVGPFIRQSDLAGRNSGQGGIQLRYKLPDQNTEVSVFAARYHDKTPNLYLTLDPATFAPSGLVHAYHEGIRTYGAGVTTNVGSVNLSAEASIRNNAPLVSDPQVLPAGSANNSNSAAYAIGKTAHLNISATHVLEQSKLWQGGVVLGEIAWNRTLSVTRNPAALDPNTTRDALAFRLLFAPSYYQVLPGLDISVPIGLGYSPKGRSSAVSGFNVHHGGDFSIGLTGEYQQVWQFGLNYVHFLGRENSYLTPANSPTPMLSFGQALKDRNFLSLNIKRTF